MVRPVFESSCDILCDKSASFRQQSRAARPQIEQRQPHFAHSRSIAGISTTLFSRASSPDTRSRGPSVGVEGTATKSRRVPPPECLQFGRGRNCWHAKSNTQEQVHQSDPPRLRAFRGIPSFEHSGLFLERVTTSQLFDEN